MDKAKREELRRLAEAATPGQWHYDGYSLIFAQPPDGHALNESVEPGEPNHACIATVPMAPDEAHGGDARFHPQTLANAAYIAAANPATILALLDHIERVEAQLDANVQAKWELAGLWHEGKKALELCQKAILSIRSRVALKSPMYEESEHAKLACEQALAPDAGREWLTRYRAMRDLFEQAWVKWGQSGVKMSDAALYGECERMLKRLDGRE